MVFVAFSLSVLTGLGWADASGFSRALEDFEAKRYEESRATLEVLVKNEPQNSLCWFNLGNAYFSLDRFADASAAYTKVVELKSKLAPAAELYRAKSLRRLGRLEAAAKELNGLNKENLPRGLRAAIAAEADAVQSEMLGRSLELYRQNRDSEAADLLELAQALKPNHEAELLLGMARLRQGRATEARAALASVARGAKNPEYRSRAEELLGLETEGAYRLSGDVSLGYNSNVYAVGDSVGPASAPAAQLELAAGKRLFAVESGELDAQYALYFEEIVDESAQRFFAHSLSLPFRYPHRAWTFQLVPELEHQTLGGEAFLLDYGGSLLTRYDAGKDEFGLSFAATKHNGGSNYGYLDGSTRAWRPFWTRNVGLGFLTLSYSDVVSRIGDFVSSTSTLPLANHLRGVSLRGGWTKGFWGGEARLAYNRLRYDNPAQPDDVIRRDEQYVLTLKFSYRIARRLRLYVADEFIVNNSNLGGHSTTNKNYRQNVVRAGLSVDYP